MQPARLVIVEEWDVLRRGLLHSLQSGYGVVAEGASASDLVDALGSGSAEVVVVGHQSPTELAVLDALVATVDPRPRLVRLVDAPTVEELRAMLRGNVDAVLSRTCSESRLVDAVASVLDGEKVVDPRFLPLLYDGETTATDDAAESGHLTTREREVLELLATGRTNREIAEQLYVGEATVKTHLSNIYAKLGATDRHHAVGRALELGLLH